jgi:hypothetical protein
VYVCVSMFPHEVGDHAACVGIIDLILAHARGKLNVSFHGAVAAHSTRPDRISLAAG